MPQMAPINWLSLFIIFSLTLMLFCSINYYSTLPSDPKTFLSKQPKTQQYSSSLNWKW